MIQAKLSPVSTKLNTVSDKVDTTSSNLSTVSSKVDTTSTKVGTIETKLGTVETSLSKKANATDLQTLTGRVGTVETGLTSKASASALEAVDSKVSNNTTNISTLRSEVDNHESRITSNDERSMGNSNSIVALTGRVSQAETELASAIADAPAVIAKAVAKKSVYKDISDTFKITSSINVGTSGVQIKTYTNTSGKDKVVTFMFYCNIDGTSGAAVLGVLPGDVNVSTAGIEVYDRPVALATGADAPDECLILSWHGVLPSGHKLCLVLTSVHAIKNHYENLSLSGDGWFNPNGVPHVCHVVLYNE